MFSDHDTTPGVAIPVKLDCLIKGLYLSPHSEPYLQESVKSLLDKFGLGAVHVVKSDLFDKPA